MPQLVKGGKYIFGWSPVGSDGRFRIPDEARLEYGFLPDEKVFIFPASKTSRGLLIIRKPVINGTVLGSILKPFPELSSFLIEKGCTVTVGKRDICWTTIDQTGIVTVPLETLERYSITPGIPLLAGRGSYLGLSMLLRGPIIEEAKRHPELKTFTA